MLINDKEHLHYVQMNSDNSNCVIKFQKYEDTDININKEAKTLLQINFPNIIRVRDCFKRKNGAGTVLEYCKGKDLADKLKKCGPMPEEHCYKLFVHLALAIKKIHDLGMFHGKLDASNVLLKNEQRSSIFGQLAKISGFTYSPGEVVCNKHYLPPEVLEGKKVDESADIWGLGVLLYVMASGGKLPFKKAEAEAIRA